MALEGRLKKTSCRGIHLRQEVFHTESHVRPGNIGCPAVTAVVVNEQGHFHEFVQAEDEVDPHFGQLQHERADEAHGDGINPHGAEVGDEAEFHVAARRGTRRTPAWY